MGDTARRTGRAGLKLTMASQKLLRWKLVGVEVGDKVSKGKGPRHPLKTTSFGGLKAHLGQLEPSSVSEPEDALQVLGVRWGPMGEELGMELMLLHHSFGKGTGGSILGVWEGVEPWYNRAANLQSIDNTLHVRAWCCPSRHCDGQEPDQPWAPNLMQRGFNLGFFCCSLPSFVRKDPTSLFAPA